MSFDVLDGLNWLAVIVAAIAWFIFGAIWYAPMVMGKFWMTAAGVEVPEGQGPNPLVFGLTLLAYFVTAIIVAALALATGTDTASEGAVLGVMLGIGFSIATSVVSATYEMKPKPLAYVLVNGVYNLIGLTIVSVIVAIWH